MSATKLPAAEFVDYLLEIGGDLLSYGCPTHRLEEVIRVVGVIQGYRTEAFAVPTGLFVSIDGPGLDAPVLRMIRVKEWSVNLERLALVDRIFNDVAEHKCDLGAARARLREVEKRAPPYPPALFPIASAGAAGAAAIFFQGGWRETLAAGFGGAILGLAGIAAGKNRDLRLLSDFLGGLIAGLLAFIVTRFKPDLSREVVVLSTVIPLVPGMALTTGLDELAHKNLVSGAARLMEAFIVFLSILFGIAMVVGLEQLLHLSAGAIAVREPEGWIAQSIALAVASASFAVLFAVPRNLMWTALVSGAIGWVAIVFGTRYLPGAVAAFVASLALCVVANGFARATNRPAQLFLLPGLVLLVPGSFGFRSLEGFLRGDFLDGAARGFEMFLIGGALVTGILVSNVVLPAKKIL